MKKTFLILFVAITSIIEFLLLDNQMFSTNKYQNHP